MKLRGVFRRDGYVFVYDKRRLGNILVVGQFEIATGVFVAVVVNRSGTVITHVALSV